MAAGSVVAVEPILHLSLPVRDVAEAQQFYVDLLGCTVGRVRDGWIDVWFYGLQLTLQEAPDQMLSDDAQGVRHFGVTLDRAVWDELVGRLQSLPVRWLSQPTTDAPGVLEGKTSAKIVDPSGNVIELKCYPDAERAFGAH
jgi:uncharacterized protein